MNWLVGLAFAIPMVLINGFVLMMTAGLFALGGRSGQILAYGFLISLIPGFLALLIRRLLGGPSPPLQKIQTPHGSGQPRQSALEALRKEKEKRRDELQAGK